MSGATARANSPFCESNSRQPAAGPGLPCTNTTASLRSLGPAWRIGDRTPLMVTVSVVTALMQRLLRGPRSRRRPREPLDRQTLDDVEAAGDVGRWPRVRARRAARR